MIDHAQVLVHPGRGRCGEVEARVHTLPGVAAPRPAVEYFSAGVMVRYVLVPSSFRPSLGLPWKEHMAGPFGVDGAPVQ
jgi:hypothetical protein